jgi:hypothetical protein
MANLLVKQADKSVETSFRFNDFKNQILIDFRLVFSDFDKIRPTSFTSNNGFWNLGHDHSNTITLHYLQNGHQR